MTRYSPALIASIRHRCEHTDEPQPKIAAEHGISLRTLQRMVADGGWARRADRPPRDLPTDMRLLQEVQALAACQEAEAVETPSDESTSSAEQATPAAESQSRPEPISAALDRIERLVERELEAEEAARAQLGRAPRSRVDAEKTARVLANLTQTLRAVQQARQGHAGPPPDCYEDMPKDIDAFRTKLAERIEAFVARHTDPEMMKEIDAIHAKYAAGCGG